MPIDEDIEEYQNRLTGFLYENEAFFVNYVLKPLFFEFLFHTTLLSSIRQSILLVMIANTFIYLINYKQIIGKNRLLFIPIALTPFFIDESPMINLFLYALLSDNNSYTGLSQAILGLIASSRYNIFIGALIIGSTTVIADSYKIIYYLNNNHRYLFYISWNQLRGYTLRSIIGNSNREARIFMDNLLEQVLCPSNLNQ